MYAPDTDTSAGQWRELPTDERIEVAVTSLRMLADPTRLRMLWLLCGADYDVTSLATAVGIARPAGERSTGPGAATSAACSPKPWKTPITRSLDFPTTTEARTAEGGRQPVPLTIRAVRAISTTPASVEL